MNKIINHNEVIPNKFHLEIQLKYLFTMIKIILIVCIYLTYDENIFSGLSLMAERLDVDYMKARTVYYLF
jgi:hypothetical protein